MLGLFCMVLSCKACHLKGDTPKFAGTSYHRVKRNPTILVISKRLFATNDGGAYITKFVQCTEVGSAA